MSKCNKNEEYSETKSNLKTFATCFYECTFCTLWIQAKKKNTRIYKLYKLFNAQTKKKFMCGSIE